MKRLLHGFVVVVAAALHFVFCTGSIEVTSSLDEVAAGAIFTVCYADRDASDTWMWRGVYRRRGHDPISSWIFGWISPMALLMSSAAGARAESGMARRTPVTLGLCCLLPPVLVLLSLFPGFYRPFESGWGTLLLLPVGVLDMLLPDAAIDWLSPFVIPVGILPAVWIAEVFFRRLRRHLAAETA